MMMIMSKGIVLFYVFVFTLTASCNLRTSGTMIGDGTVPPEVIKDSGSDEAIENAPVDAQPDLLPDMPEDTVPDLPVDGGSDEPDCPPGEIYCEGSCVDPDWNPDHCGWCGNACGEGERCCEGSCRMCCNASHCDDGEPCTTDTCSGGTCSHTALADMDECDGGRGVCCWGTCRIGGNCCVNADCGDGTGSCRGTPTPCSTYYNEEANCNALHGCYWAGPPPHHCEGTAVACAEMSARCTGCGCMWDSGTGVCSGSPASSCGSVYGYPEDCDFCQCSYPMGPPPRTCYEPAGYGCHLFSCATQEGCVWTGSETGTCIEFTCI